MSDNSPDLKKGEIKQILIQNISETLSDFEFLAYKNKCYTFQRLKLIKSFRVYELIHLNFSLKDKNLSCSIASTLNPDYIFSNQYNNGIINPHLDLKALKHCSSTLKFEDAYYFHNGKVEGTTNTVAEIMMDYKNYGIPLLDKHYRKLITNPIVQFGLDYISALEIDKRKLKVELIKELGQAGYEISRLKHPIYIELKENLQLLENLSKDERKLIPKTSYELLELYCQNETNL